MKLRLLGLMAGSLLVVALAGCGTPGAPSLPSLNLARPVEDLAASRRGNKVDLDWTLPRKNTDRTNIKHNPTTLICRHEGTTLMDKCEVVAEVAPPTAKAPQKQKGEGPPGDVRIHYVDTLPPQLGLKDPDGFVTYAVEEINAHGRSAGLSNQVAIPVVPTLAAPDKVNADVKADGVHVTWTGPAPPAPPQGVTYLYRIMRRPVGAPAYIVLDDVPPAATGSYLDKTFGWEQKYEYRITTLSQVHAEGLNAAVEGEDSSAGRGIHARHLSSGATRWTAGGFLQRRTEAVYRSDLGSEHGERPGGIQRLSLGRGRPARQAECPAGAGGILSGRNG